MTFSELQSKGAGVRRHPSLPLLISAVVAAALTLTGCAAGPRYSAEPRDDLAAKAQVNQSDQTTATRKPRQGHHHKHHRPGSPGGAATPGSTSGDTGGGSGTGGPTGSTTASVPPPPAGWSRAVSLSDGSGDLGLTGGPSYADVTQVAVDDNGSRARFTVNLAGHVPVSLPSGEVEGIGLDIFRGGGVESDYQLFLDCGNGWRAFLQTPKGFVAFPGSLVVGDQTLTVEVPWSSIGGRSSFDLGLFADWSREGGLVNQSSQDSAPNSGSTHVPVG